MKTLPRIVMTSITLVIVVHVLILMTFWRGIDTAPPQPATLTFDVRFLSAPETARAKPKALPAMLSPVEHPQPTRQNSPAPQRMQPKPSPSRSAMHTPIEPPAATSAPAAPAAPATHTPIPVPVAASFDAAYLDNPAPQYPLTSRRRHEQGTVLLKVAVSANGRVSRITIVSSSGFARLDEAAVDAVRQWRFVPGHQGQINIDSTVQVPIIFALDNRN